MTQEYETRSKPPVSEAFFFSYLNSKMAAVCEGSGRVAFASMA